MKKMIFGLIATVLVSVNVNAQDLAYNYNENKGELYASNDLFSSNIYEVNSNVDRDIFQSRGWQIAGADAVAAIGTAGSVAGIASWVGWTPAAPVAALTVGISAIVGGIAGSVAVSSATGDVPNNPTDIDLNEILFPDNYFDKVGVLHNKILFEYYSQTSTHSPKSYYDFIDKNKSKYGIKELVVSYDYIENLYNVFKNLRSINEINQYTLESLPKNVDKNIYSKFLNDLSNITDSKQAINFIKEFEGKELKKPEYDDKTKALLGGYFSTYRHSIALWYE